MQQNSEQKAGGAEWSFDGAGPMVRRVLRHEALPDWLVTITAGFDPAGAFVVTSLQVSPEATVPEGGVTSSMLRSLRVPQLLSETIGDHVIATDAPTLTEYVRDRLQAGDSVQRKTGGRPRLHDDRFLAQLAIDWAAATAEGRGAYGRLAEARGEKQTTIKHWVDLATQRGFLHPPGGAGGPRPRMATPAAFEVAREETGS